MASVNLSRFQAENQLKRDHQGVGYACSVAYTLERQATEVSIAAHMFGFFLFVTYHLMDN